MTDAIALGVIVALVLLAWIHRILSQMPLRLAREREEAERVRAADDARSQQALREAASARAEALLSGIRAYHERIEAELKAEVAGAEVRARAAERSVADMTTALETATTLVRELRSAIHDVRSDWAETSRAPRPVRAAPPPSAPDLDSRETLELPGKRLARALADEPDEPEEELTQVTKKPVAGTRAAPNGLRLVQGRAAIPPPSAPSEESDLF